VKVNAPLAAAVFGSTTSASKGRFSGLATYSGCYRFWLPVAVPKLQFLEQLPIKNVVL
jgi:hypothetical protein